MTGALDMLQSGPARQELENGEALIVKIEFLYFEDCPSHDKALERLRQVMAEAGVDAPIDIIKVETEADAAHWRFTGSPTIRFDGQDIAPPPAGTDYLLSCRVYRHEDGRFSPLPSPETIRQALRRAVAG